MDVRPFHSQFQNQRDKLLYLREWEDNANASSADIYQHVFSMLA